MRRSWLEAMMTAMMMRSSSSSRAMVRRMGAGQGRGRGPAAGLGQAASVLQLARRAARRGVLRQVSPACHAALHLRWSELCALLLHGCVLYPFRARQQQTSPQLGPLSGTAPQLPCNSCPAPQLL